MEQKESKPDPRYRLRIMLLHRTWVKVTFGFILGVFTGILLYGIFGITREEPVDTGEMVHGTVYNSHSYESMKPADVIYFNTPAVTFACDVRYSTTIVEGRIDVTSEFPVQIFVEFSYSDFRVMTVQNLTGDGEPGTAWSTSYLRIDNTGTNKFVFRMYNMNSLPHQLLVRVVQNDMQIYSNSVMVNKE